MLNPLRLVILLTAYSPELGMACSWWAADQEPERRKDCHYHFYSSSHVTALVSAFGGRSNHQENDYPICPLTESSYSLDMLKILQTVDRLILGTQSWGACPNRSENHYPLNVRPDGDSQRQPFSRVEPP